MKCIFYHNFFKKGVEGLRRVYWRKMSFLLLGKHNECHKRRSNRIAATAAQEHVAPPPGPSIGLLRRQGWSGAIWPRRHIREEGPPPHTRRSLSLGDWLTVLPTGSTGRLHQEHLSGDGNINPPAFSRHILNLVFLCKITLGTGVPATLDRYIKSVYTPILAMERVMMAMVVVGGWQHFWTQRMLAPPLGIVHFPCHHLSAKAVPTTVLDYASK